MKKMFSLLISFIFIASLCACGNSGTGSSETTPGNADSNNISADSNDTSNEQQEILEALTSDGGEWGCFSGDVNSPFTVTGPKLYYYRFTDSGTFTSYRYEPTSYNMGIEYAGGHEGTYEIGDNEINYTYELTTDAGTEIKTSTFSYTYEDGVLELSVPSGQYHKDDWEGIVENIRESGVFDMIEEYRLDS